MRFKLFDSTGEVLVHEGVMPTVPPRAVVTWGARVFVRRGQVTEAATAGGAVVTSFVEVPSFQIGGVR